MPPGFVDGRYYQPPRSESSNLGDHGAPLVDDVLRSGDGTPDWAHHHGSIRHVSTRIAIEQTQLRVQESSCIITSAGPAFSDVLQVPHNARDRDESVLPAMMPARSPSKGWINGEVEMPLTFAVFMSFPRVDEGLRRAEGSPLCMLRCMRW